MPSMGHIAWDKDPQFCTSLFLIVRPQACLHLRLLDSMGVILLSLQPSLYVTFIHLFAGFSQTPFTLLPGSH